MPAPTIPPHALKVFKAYGTGAWLPVTIAGWNGGQDPAGMPVNHFRTKLHERSLHFVRDTSPYIYYVRLGSDDIRRVVAELRQITREIKHTAPRMEHNGWRNSRTKLKFHDTIFFDEPSQCDALGDSVCSSASTTPPPSSRAHWSD